VDSGDLMSAKKGARVVVSGIVFTSMWYPQISLRFYASKKHIPVTSFTILFKTLKPAMSSRSLPPRAMLLLGPTPLPGPETRKPKLSANALSLSDNAVLDVAQRAFLRIVAVTAEISDNRTCRTGMVVRALWTKRCWSVISV
jgi:hypothetical protein